MTNSDKQSKRLEALLRDMLITQLAVAGVGQKEIRSIVGGDIVRVNMIVKRIPKSSKRKKSERN